MPLSQSLSLSDKDNKLEVSEKRDERRKSWELSYNLTVGHNFVQIIFIYFPQDAIFYQRTYSVHFQNVFYGLLYKYPVSHLKVDNPNTFKRGQI